MMNIDIKENKLFIINEELLDELLKDKTTKKNIIWATNIYSNRGNKYSFNSQIKKELVTGYYGNLVKPRVAKSKSEMKRRVKDNAEVFTPSWICNVQNNLVDEQWFGEKGVFNTEIDEHWKTNNGRIDFEKVGKSWKEYINSTWLEVSCGEAPYITSRYDTVSGKYIEVPDRIGILDRKLRVINENVLNVDDWNYYAKEALKSTYGFEWQGDNLLIARENVLFTVIEHFSYKFGIEVEPIEYLNFAKIISWNLWQMDGTKFVIPNSCVEKREVDRTLFGEEEIIVVCPGCQNNDYRKHNGIYCRIKDWEKNKVIKFIDLMGEK